MKVKSDHRSKFSNLSNWKEEAWKKNQGFNGMNPVEALIFFNNRIVLGLAFCCIV